MEISAIMIIIILMFWPNMTKILSVWTENMTIRIVSTRYFRWCYPFYQNPSKTIIFWWKTEFCFSKTLFSIFEFWHISFDSRFSSFDIRISIFDVIFDFRLFDICMYIHVHIDIHTYMYNIYIYIYIYIHIYLSTPGSSIHQQ